MSLPTSQHYGAGKEQGREASPEKGGVTTVQYAKMVDLLQEAEVAGETQTEFVNERKA